MKTHSRGRRILPILAIALLVSAIAPGWAFGQTPEGTTITNKATVTFTDANGNTYTPVDGSVSIRVGFLAGIDVTVDQPNHTPGANTDNNEIVFTVANIGNGTDSVSVNATVSDPAVVTNVRYRVGTTTFTSLTDLNEALSAIAITEITGTVQIVVIYDVPEGQGGKPSTVELTATSRRDNDVSDAESTIVTPALTGTIGMLSSGDGTARQLPSNGTTPYSFAFTLTNNQSGTDTFDLSALSSDLTVMQFVEIEVGGNPATEVTLNAGDNAVIMVRYTVGAVAALSTATLTLTATSRADNTKEAEAVMTLTVIRPAMTVTKEAYKDDRTTKLDPATDEVLPGDYIQYKITVENDGDAPAKGVSIVDELPSQVNYDSHDSDGLGNWTIDYDGSKVTATFGADLVKGTPRHIWIRVQIK